MKTTLRKIWAAHPCGKNSDHHGWGLLTKNLGTNDLDTEVTFKKILDSNGIKDAVWALRTIDYDEQCLFLADVVESVLPIFESRHPNDDRPRKAINAIRDFKDGKITKRELLTANAAAYTAYTAAADAAAAAAAYTAAAAAAYTAAAAAYTAADAAADAAYTAAYTAAAAAAYAAADAAADAAGKGKWEEIENLFIKYFC